MPCFPQIAEPSCKIIGEQVVDCVVNLRCDYKVTIFNELEPISTTRKCIENWITECSVASHANPLIRCIDKSYLTSKKYATYGVGAPCKNYFGLDGICALLLNCPSGAIEYASQINNHVYSQYIQDSNCNTETEFSICCAPEISLVQVMILANSLIFHSLIVYFCLYLHEREKCRVQTPYQLNTSNHLQSNSRAYSRVQTVYSFYQSKEP